MTEIEQRSNENQKFIKKILQVRLSILEMMIEGQIITISLLVKRTRIPRGSVYKYVELLLNEGRIVVTREREEKKSRITNIYLTEEGLSETYNILLPNITQSDIERILMDLEQKKKDSNL